MGRLKTLLRPSATCLILLAQAPALCAETRPDPMPLFATCTGRLSALMEFQWLVQDADADRTKARRDAMADLLDTVTPEALRIHAMQLRLEAKMAATDVLLRRWRRGLDTDAAAEVLLARCGDLMLS